MKHKGITFSIMYRFFRPWTVQILALIIVLGLATISCQKKPDFTIVSGSENKTLEPLIHQFGKEIGVNFQVTYKGSVDIMLELQNDEFTFDAVWPANSLWINLGDTKKRVKHVQSIMTSPVVFGIKKSLAQRLGFIDKDVTINDILQAIQQDKLRFIMTAATQSNSGANAFLGFLYALAGNPDVLTMQHLNNAAIKRNIKKILSGVNRSSGSSGWLKELFLKSGKYNAMVNYEALIIETNQELVKQNKEPLYAVYPKDGLVVADSPLGYVSRGDQKKEKIFIQLQKYLLSKTTQQKLLDHGRRVGFGGTIDQANLTIFNPQWGIDTKKILSPIRLPNAQVIFRALRMYQTEFRKPSLTVFCLDFSGSMSGTGNDQLQKAMAMILDSETTARYFISFSPRDKTIVIPFSHKLKQILRQKGNNVQALTSLKNQIARMNPHGGTDIYSPLIHGLGLINKEPNLQDYFPAIILMTDGISNRGSFRDFQKEYLRLGLDVPVFSILFGKAKKKQLQEITDLTNGKIFDGRKDLVKTFRKVRGYNL